MYGRGAHCLIWQSQVAIRWRIHIANLGPLSRFPEQIRSATYSPLRRLEALLFAV